MRISGSVAWFLCVSNPREIKHSDKVLVAILFAATVERLCSEHIHSCHFSWQQFDLLSDFLPTFVYNLHVNQYHGKYLQFGIILFLYICFYFIIFDKLSPVAMSSPFWASAQIHGVCLCYGCKSVSKMDLGEYFSQYSKELYTTCSHLLLLALLSSFFSFFQRCHVASFK